MDTYVDDIDKILSEWAENVVIQIKDNLDSTGTTASGKTKESLRYEAENGNLTIYGRQYFQGVEIGRGAGKIPYKFQDILYDWAEAKGILSNFGDTEKQQRSALYMVGQFIKEHGTELWRGTPRTDIYTDLINDELPKLEEELASKLVKIFVNK